MHLYPQNVDSESCWRERSMDPLLVLSPRHSSMTHGITPGSAIVTSTERWDRASEHDGSLPVYYQELVSFGESLTFLEALKQCSGRGVVGYPTIASGWVPRDNFAQVGLYVPGNGRFRVIDRPALAAWVGDVPIVEADSLLPMSDRLAAMIPLERRYATMENYRYLMGRRDLLMHISHDGDLMQALAALPAALGEGARDPIAAPRASSRRGRPSPR